MRIQQRTGRQYVTVIEGLDEYIRYNQSSELNDIDEFGFNATTFTNMIYTETNNIEQFDQIDQNVQTVQTVQTNISDESDESNKSNNLNNLDKSNSSITNEISNKKKMKQVDIDIIYTTLKKILCCGGHLKETDKGKIIILQGDNRDKIVSFLINNKYIQINKKNIVVHGY